MPSNSIAEEIKGITLKRSTHLDNLKTSFNATKFIEDCMHSFLKENWMDESEKALKETYSRLEIISKSFLIPREIEICRDNWHRISRAEPFCNPGVFNEMEQASHKVMAYAMYIQTRVASRGVNY